MSAPTPVWSRPDDAVRQAQLDAMKRRATGLPALAAAVFGAAAPLETRYPWLGYVRPPPEAQQVAVGIAKTLDALPDDEMRPLVHEVVTARLRTLRVAPTLGKTLSLVLAGDAHQDLLSEAVRLAAQAVHDNRDVIRRQVRAES